MNSEEEAVLNRFKTMLLERVDLHALILFGSRARVEVSGDSDMDVLVVVRELTTEVEDAVSDCAWEAGFEHGIVVAPVTFSTAEWVRGPHRYSLLAKAVEREGIEIWTESGGRTTG